MLGLLHPVLKLTLDLPATPFIIEHSLNNIGL